jgi:hypothetical protein
LNAIQALSQLSYGPIESQHPKALLALLAGLGSPGRSGKIGKSPWACKRKKAGCESALSACAQGGFPKPLDLVLHALVHMVDDFGHVIVILAQIRGVLDQGLVFLGGFDLVGIVILDGFQFLVRDLDV